MTSYDVREITQSKCCKASRFPLRKQNQTHNLNYALKSIPSILKASMRKTNFLKL